MMNKKFRSIDGFYNNKTNYEFFNIEKIKKKNSILGCGNSISALPFDHRSSILINNSVNKISINNWNSTIRKM